MIFQILLLRWNLIWEVPTKILARIMDTDNCPQMETNFPLLLGIMGTNMAKMNVVIGLFMLQELNTLNLLLIKWKWVFFTIFFFCSWLPFKKKFSDWWEWWLFTSIYWDWKWRSSCASFSYQAWQKNLDIRSWIHVYILAF